jgi:ankyrin repeat protein
MVAGADVGDKTVDMRTALFEAVSSMSFSVARRLLERGAQANIQDRWGKTPLHLLCERPLITVRALDVARLIVARDPGIANVADEDGM